MTALFGRPFGATTFAGFWQYWNPVVGYFLAKYCYGPLRTVLPRSVSIVITFTVCGLLHELPFAAWMAASGAGRPSFAFTKTFMVLGVFVAMSEWRRWNLSRVPRPLRWLVHASVIVSAWLLSSR